MHKVVTIVLLSIVIFSGCTNQAKSYQGLSNDLIHPGKDTVLSESIIYHHIRVDNYGNILPWYSANPGESYDVVMNKVWNFWKNMQVDSNGNKYYLNHQVWRPEHDKRGLGGDQLMMALSSWDMFYNYTGDESVLENMKYMADYYLAHSLSSPDSKWPDLPYPYNTVVESGICDGDMILGKGYLQPDKAGSFGFELLKFYKKTGDEKYLTAAVKIANTMALKVDPGDNDNSPWPFKVNAETGETGFLIDTVGWYEGMSDDLEKSNLTKKKSAYTTNWTSTLELFTGLIALQKGNTDAYKKAFDTTISWLKTYPAKTNKWGPFFEDVPKWSDTQINGITYAMYIMEHPDLDPNWKETVNNIFQWVYKELGDKEYLKYGIICIDEQTYYRVPGNSHTARQGSVELMYWELTGDTTYNRNAVHQLNWATYMVDNDGKNRFPRDDIWLTDGYGDYIRHYIRAMASAPQLAPENADHLLRTSSTVCKIVYQPAQIIYNTFDNTSNEVFRLCSKPKSLKVNGNLLKEVNDNNSEGWIWQSLDNGGILRINHSKGNEIAIIK
ncbi:MAG: hypothetical protein WAO52_10100 [Prolixibacteraceae bacterium]